jgi:hypothetical protein
MMRAAQPNFVDDTPPATAQPRNRIVEFLLKARWRPSK